MTAKDELKRAVCAAIDRQGNEIIELGEQILHHPETGFNEGRTAALVADRLRGLGLAPQTGLALTGVKARLAGRRSGPSLALVGELDSLRTSDHPLADPHTGAAHSCGHNAQLAGMLGAAMGLMAAGAPDPRPAHAIDAPLLDVTLLGIGRHPGRFVSAIGGVPVADYVAAYEDEMEALRAFDRALFGGTPDEMPEGYRRSSPISYVDDVKAPVLILAGANDPRCPIRQIENYLARLALRGLPHEVYRFDAGHGSLVVEEHIRQIAAELDFARRHLGLG